MRICVLDLGALSFNLLHARVTRDGRVIKLSSNRRLIRLGALTVRTGVICDAAWAAGLDALRDLAREIEVLAPDRVVVVGTSALRDTANGHAFAAAARHLYNLSIHLLSEEEQSKLTYWGAVSELASSTGRVAVIDLGGGSIDFSVGIGPHCEAATSVPLGVLALRDAFALGSGGSDSGQALDRYDADSIATMVKMSVEPAVRMVRAVGPDRVVFASGTARALYRYGRVRMGAEVEPGWLSAGQVYALRDDATGRLPDDYYRDGVEAERSDLMAITAVVVQTLVRLLGDPAIQISTRGLREGVALRELARARATGDASAATRTLSISRPGQCDSCPP